MWRYVEQVEEQRKEQLALVIIEEKEEWEVERIWNKQRIRGKDKHYGFGMGLFVRL